MISRGCPQELEDGENDKYLYGVCAMQGWRTEMARPNTIPPVCCPAGSATARASHSTCCHDCLLTRLVRDLPWLFIFADGRLKTFCNVVPQEDAHAIALGLADRPDAALFAIYDGHGGKEVAKFAAEHMVRWLCLPPVLRTPQAADALAAAR